MVYVTMERTPETPTENPEIVALIGHVAVLFQVMKNRPGATALPRTPDQRAANVDMVEHWLDAVYSVQIGVVTPSTHDSPEGARTRHPSAQPRSHLEVWHTYRRPGREVTTTNYRLYAPPHARVLQPRNDGRPPRNITPESMPERWGKLVRLINEVDRLVKPNEDEIRRYSAPPTTE